MVHHSWLYANTKLQHCCPKIDQYQLVGSDHFLLQTSNIHHLLQPHIQQLHRGYQELLFLLVKHHEFALVFSNLQGYTHRQYLPNSLVSLTKGTLYVWCDQVVMRISQAASFTISSCILIPSFSRHPISSRLRPCRYTFT